MKAPSLIPCFAASLLLGQGSILRIVQLCIQSPDHHFHALCNYPPSLQLNNSCGAFMKQQQLGKMHNMSCLLAFPLQSGLLCVGLVNPELRPVSHYDGAACRNTVSLPHTTLKRTIHWPSVLLPFPITSSYSWQLRHDELPDQ